MSKQKLTTYYTQKKKIKVWFGFFVSWHINLCRLFNAKAILPEEQQWYYLTHSWEDKGFHTFPKGICPKVNELAYYDSSVHRLNITPRGHPQNKSNS